MGQGNGTGCHGKAAQIECLLGAIRPTTDRAELRRIFRKLDRLGVHCSGNTDARGVGCTGPGEGEGWRLGFEPAGQPSG